MVSSCHNTLARQWIYPHLDLFSRHVSQFRAVFCQSKSNLSRSFSFLDFRQNPHSCHSENFFKYPEKIKPCCTCCSPLGWQRTTPVSGCGAPELPLLAVLKPQMSLWLLERPCHSFWSWLPSTGGVFGLRPNVVIQASGFLTMTCKEQLKW